MKFFGKIIAFCFLIIAVYRILNIVDNHVDISDTFKGYFLIAVAICSIVVELILKRRKKT